AELDLARRGHALEAAGEAHHLLETERARALGLTAAALRIRIQIEREVVEDSVLLRVLDPARNAPPQPPELRPPRGIRLELHAVFVERIHGIDAPGIDRIAEGPP